MDQRAANPEDSPFRVECHLHVPELVPLLGGGGEMLAAVLDPLHRAAEDAGGQRHHRFLGIEDELGPEPAADIRGDHAQLVLAAAEQVAEHRMGAVGHLGAAPHGELAVVGIEPGEHPPALDGVPEPFVLMHVRADRMRRRGESPVAIPVGHGERGDQVVGNGAVGGRCAVIERPSAVDRGREGVVVDLDQGGRVFRTVGVVRDYRRHRLADIADLSVGEDRRVEHMPDRSRGLGERHGDPGYVGAKLVEGEDRANPRRGHSSRNVDPANPCVGLAAPHEGGVQEVREAKIVDETGPAPQERRVLDPRNPLSERHGLTQPPST